MGKPLIIIGGPTGTGKSEVACCVACRLGAEIISADSMAVYRDMNVGTAKPVDCMRLVKHHLIDIVYPGEYFDAKLFEELALSSIREIYEQDKVVVVVGGTYLYIQVLLYGIEETPDPNWELRRRLYKLAERKGTSFLFEKLRIVDPFYASKIHPNDLRRTVRALEVFIETGKRFSSFHSWEEPRFKYIGFFLNRSWENLSKRIEERVFKMFESGLVDEVKHLIDRGFEKFLTSTQAIGYKELIPYFKGNISIEDAIREVIKNTKEYARRQVRWFRKQGWVEIDMDRCSKEEACDKIISMLKSQAIINFL